MSAGEKKEKLTFWGSRKSVGIPCGGFFLSTLLFFLFGRQIQKGRPGRMSRANMAKTIDSRHAIATVRLGEKKKRTGVMPPGGRGRSNSAGGGTTQPYRPSQHRGEEREGKPKPKGASPSWNFWKEAGCIKKQDERKKVLTQISRTPVLSSKSKRFLLER